MADNGILLKEYELCEEQSISIGHEIWLATTIFLTVSVMSLTGLIYGAMTSNIFSKGNVDTPPQIVTIMILVGIVVVGIGIGISLWWWIQWIKRMQFLTRINYARMHEIEGCLGMYKNWLAYGFDLKNNPSAYRDSFCELPKELKEKINTLDKNVQYASPAGFRGLIRMAWTMIGVWGVFTIIVLFLIILTAIG
jgi:hypothetical protein